jgi:L-glutamine-phosphate cytidylyltransferase
MRAIILAAGQGTRLGDLTRDKPKCMVELLGRPLLHHQVDALRAAGIHDIHVVAGYRAEKIEHPGLIKHINPRYATTNMVATLFSAPFEDGLEGDLIIAYGDIVYRPEVVRRLVACDAPICLAIDLDWRSYWEKRMDDPLSDAETLKLDESGRVLEVGKKATTYDDIQGQYIGLIKVARAAIGNFRTEWTNIPICDSCDGSGRETMYMTAYLQHLIDAGWRVAAVPFGGGWAEVDSPDDLALVARYGLSTFR